MRLSQERAKFLRRLARDAFAVVSVVYIAILLTGSDAGGGDGHAYWLARLPDPYSAPIVGLPDGYYYSPAFAQAIAPLTVLPWPAFYAALVAVCLACLYWLVGPWALPALLLPPVAIEVRSANIALPMAVAIVVGLRYPVAWAPVILTKVLPGVGVLWFALRGEWRSLVTALAATAAIMFVSFLLAPSLWWDWATILRASAETPSVTWYASYLIPRLIAAVVIVIVAARTRRAWLLPVAMVLSAPVVWPATLTLLLAIPRLRGSWNPDRPPAGQPHGPGVRAAVDQPASTGAGSPPVPVTERTTGT